MIDETHDDRAATEMATVVARFHSVAEAGYFSDVLEAEGIAVRVHTEETLDHFGTPTIRFVLLVRDDDAHRAVSLLREHADETEATFRRTRENADEPSRREHRSRYTYEEPDSGGSGVGAIVFGMIGIAVLGAVVYVALDRGPINAARNPPAAQAVDEDEIEALWDVVAAEPGVWKRVGRNGRVDVIVVGEDGEVEHHADTDGDGRLDEDTDIRPPRDR